MSQGPQENFRLFDAACLIVGIIVGAGIYETAPAVASSVQSAPAVLWLWLCGGLISLCGAFCYTELAAAYPRDGGDMVYLSKAYGRWAGFLFCWLQMSIVRPGDIAAMAFVFARYAKELGALSAFSDAHVASLAVVAFSLLNLYGLSQARATHNTMTVVKIIGLAVLIVVGFTTEPPVPAPQPEAGSGLPIGVALVLILFCYGGWNEMAYIAAEVRDPQRNIFRAMVLGMALVMAIYLCANGAFMAALGHHGVTQSSAVAVDVVAARYPTIAQQAVAALIAFSALGALNGQILTGARVSYSAGTEFRLFRRLGQWNTKRQVPVSAFLLQLTISLLLINLLARFTDTLLYMASSVYTFYLASSLAVIVLRRRDPQTKRPYQVYGYPISIILFAIACLYMIYSAVSYRPLIAGISLLVLACGGVLYVAFERHGPVQRRANR